MFIFRQRSEITDPRSVLANHICELLCVHRHGGDVSRALDTFSECYDLLHEVIRNFYECVHTEVPFAALYELRKHGKDNFDMTEEEYTAAVKVCEQAVGKYFFPENA